MCPSVRSRPAQVPRQRGGNRDREWNRSACQAAMGIRSNEQLEWDDDVMIVMLIMRQRSTVLKDMKVIMVMRMTAIVYRVDDD